jgi:hypothetical protein
LGGILVLMFAASSWKSQPWGLATFILAVVVVNVAGAILMHRLARRQHIHGTHHHQAT